MPKNNSVFKILILLITLMTMSFLTACYTAVPNPSTPDEVYSTDDEEEVFVTDPDPEYSSEITVEYKGETIEFENYEDYTAWLLEHRDYTQGGLNETEVTLPVFCNDPELDSWFEGLKKNPPVKLTYVLYGEGSVSKDFNDPELLLNVAQAMRTVTIGPESLEDPDNVADAPGRDYYFFMEDGSNVRFSFFMGSFKWKDSKWHYVNDYGELSEYSDYLNKKTNPEYVSIYSEDNGFYTSRAEYTDTEWKPEEGYAGGLYIYPVESDKSSFVEIKRYEDISEEPSDFLAGEYTDHLNSLDDPKEGSVTTDIKEPAEFKIGGKELPGIICTLKDDKGNTRELLTLLMEDTEDILDEEVLIQFCAQYDPLDNDNKNLVMDALSVAVHDFVLKYRSIDGENEFLPGNTLIEFCNSESLSKWIERAEERPLELSIWTTSQEWYSKDDSGWWISSDPEVIEKVLDALQTVKIGEKTMATGGASNAKIFDFYDMETDNLISFNFHSNTFSLNDDDESYKVLDWGEMNDLKIELKDHVITLK
ncbi:MAG: hypothetical protein K6B28_13235 [Lachnospiraceae bacterium]|nr:hypothetical protein [Lachnospiraceae bacterium]